MILVCAFTDATKFMLQNKVLCMSEYVCVCELNLKCDRHIAMTYWHVCHHIYTNACKLFWLQIFSLAAFGLERTKFYIRNIMQK